MQFWNIAGKDIQRANKDSYVSNIVYILSESLWNASTPFGL